MPKLTDKSKTTVTITRNTGSWGSLTPISIFANDEKIGQLYKGEHTTFDVGEGTYRFRVEMSGGYKSDELVLDMKIGETANIDISAIEAVGYMMPIGIVIVLVNLWALMSRGVLSNIVRLVVCIGCLFMLMPLFTQRKLDITPPQYFRIHHQNIS